MGSIDVAWQVEGIISPEQSVSSMINVIQSKGLQHSGTFWTWEDKVRLPIRCLSVTDLSSCIHGEWVRKLVRWPSKNCTNWKAFISTHSFVMSIIMYYLLPISIYTGYVDARCGKRFELSLFRQTNCQSVSTYLGVNLGRKWNSGFENFNNEDENE